MQLKNPSNKPFNKAFSMQIAKNVAEFWLPMWLTPWSTLFKISLGQNGPSILFESRGMPITQQEKILLSKVMDLFPKGLKVHEKQVLAVIS